SKSLNFIRLFPGPANLPLKCIRPGMSTAWVSIPNLTTLRQQRGISLGQIAAQTKIGVHYLEGIECGQFAKLPGGLYTPSSIRQYARAIGFPEDDLLRVYRETCLPKLTLTICERD